jgi:GPI ethanolamine phosphate transferase 3 subunit O
MLEARFCDVLLIQDNNNAYQKQHSPAGIVSLSLHVSLSEMRQRPAGVSAHLFFFFLHCAAFGLFTRGFFLTRLEVPDVSREAAQCTGKSAKRAPLGIPEADWAQLHALSRSNGRASNSEKRDSDETHTVRENADRENVDADECWEEAMPAPRFKKAVVLVIDALRYEYAHWFRSGSESGEERSSNDAQNETDLADQLSHENHRNQLPILHHLLAEAKTRQNAFLFRFRADPPTVTMQRLKGLTTGAMPTFIDFSENFASSALSEDNIVHQLGRAGRKVVFMGDDTWEALFPGQFARSYPYDSFNVKDLHTVDNGVLGHLVPEITQQKEPWDVIIGHFLGVDHVGHRYDANHAEMKPKLAQMNRMIEDVIAAIDDDTLLIVMGDHGSTDDGNHGGASEEELNAALFMFSKTPINTSPRRQAGWPPRTISQTDLVPTLSLLLGLPIPFGNLGAIIPELFTGADLDMPAPDDAMAKLRSLWDVAEDSPPFRVDLEPTDDGVARLADLVIVQHANAWQIRRYVERYAGLSSTFPPAELARLRENFAEAVEEFRSTARLIGKSGSARSVRDSLLKTAELYRRFQLGTTEMCRRVWVEFDLPSMNAGLALFILALPAHILYIGALRAPLGASSMIQASLRDAALLFVVGGVLGAVFPYDPLPWTIRALAGAMAAACVFFGAALLRRGSPRNLVLDDPASLVFCAALVVVHGLGMTSNSFVEAEGPIVRFVAMSVGLLIVLTPNLQVLACSDGSRPYAHKHAVWGVFAVLTPAVSRLCGGGVYETPDNSMLWFAATTLAPFLLFVLGIDLFVMQFEDLGRQEQAKADISGGAARRSRWALAALVASYWTLQQSGIEAQLPGWSRVILPRLVYVSSVVLVVREARSPMPSVTKWARILAIFAIPLVMLQGLLGPTSFSVLALHVAAISRVLLSEERVGPKKTGPRRVLVPQFGILTAFSIGVWYLGTGQTYDFAGLHWASAFIGFEEMSFVGGFVLMTAATAGSAILIGFSLPLSVWFGLRDLPRGIPATERVLEASQWAILVLLWNSICAVSAAYMHRRHLMVWRVFAPTFLFQGGFLLVADLILMAASWLAVRTCPSERKIN